MTESTLQWREVYKKVIKDTAPIINITMTYYVLIILLIIKYNLTCIYTFYMNSFC